MPEAVLPPNAPALVEHLAGCPICGSSAFRRLHLPETWIGEPVFHISRSELGLTECRECSFVFINPRPTDALLEQFYGGDTYECHAHSYEQDAQRQKAVFTLGYLARLCPPERTRLLDFGCGGGYFLACAHSMGWRDPLGFDIGRHALESCRSIGVPVVDSLVRLNQEGGFDLITLNHVFEHMRDHGSALQMFRQLLRPGGRLFLEVPNVNSLRARLAMPYFRRRFGFDERHRAFPIHLSYFSPRTLALCLQKHGFATEVVTTCGLGLDELVDRSRPSPVSEESSPRPGLEESAHDADASPSAAQNPAPIVHQPSASRNPVKAVVKKAILETGLGENVMVVARPQ